MSVKKLKSFLFVLLTTLSVVSSAKIGEQIPRTPIDPAITTLKVGIDAEARARKEAAAIDSKEKNTPLISKVKDFDPNKVLVVFALMAMTLLILVLLIAYGVAIPKSVLMLTLLSVIPCQSVIWLLAPNGIWGLGLKGVLFATNLSIALPTLIWGAWHGFKNIPFIQEIAEARGTIRQNKLKAILEAGNPPPGQEFQKLR